MSEAPAGPRPLLRALFDAAVAAADPAVCLPPHLPPRPKGRTLVMRFGTKTSLSDIPGLRKEADELWEHFVVNVDRGGYKRAVISAVAPDKAVSKAVDFVYVKRAGDWRTLVTGLGPKDKLTERFLRSLAGRSRRLEFHRNYNALLLYLAKDWTITYTYPRKFGIEPFWIDRETLIEWNERLWSGRKTGSRGDMSGRLEILRINVSDNGMAAQAEIRITGHMNIRGQLVSMIGRYISNIELRQGALVSTHAHMLIEEVAVAVEH